MAWNNHINIIRVIKTDTNLLPHHKDCIIQPYHKQTSNTAYKLPKLFIGGTVQKHSSTS